ncbi:MAG: glycosyl transferase family 2 [Bacillaceae bacterium G1]|nr:glycosyl transferase family 2 [Bacillota bacterium]OJF17937.1 MAG: glycosyl transferase family 2 [Bacillaceae bacterium G1]
MSDAGLPLVSVIIPVKNEGQNVRMTVESAFHVKTLHPFEIIVVDDGSTDDGCRFLDSWRDKPVKVLRTEGIGAAAARNLGAEHARGEFFIFCDAHLFFQNYWLDHLVSLIQSGLADAVTPGIASIHRPNVVGYGQTLNRMLGVQWNKEALSPVPTAILPGGCLAIGRRTFFDVGGFDRKFRVWGFEDVELSIKLWLFGYTCYVQPLVKVLHLFRQSHPYSVTMEHVYYNMMRMAYSHFNETRIAACRNLIQHVDSSRIEEAVLADGVLEQRRQYMARRKYDDEWFMRRFGIPF